MNKITPTALETHSQVGYDSGRRGRPSCPGPEFDRKCDGMDTKNQARQKNCPCVFPSPTEQELVTIPGAEPGTALRVRVEPGRDGYVRLEHLAYNANIGWYTQKSFCIAGELLGQLVPALRKADCLTPTAKTQAADAGQLLRLMPPVESADAAPRLERRSS